MPHFFPYIPVLMAIGIGGYFSLPLEPVWTMTMRVVFAIVMGCLVMLWWCRHHHFQSHQRFVWSYGTIHSILYMTIGFGIAMLHTHQLGTFFLKAPLKDVMIQGTIQEIENQAHNKKRYTLNQITWPMADVYQGDEKKIHKIRLKGASVAHASIGSRLQCLVSLLPISNPVSPYGHHFKRDYYFKGIGATGVLKECVIVKQAPPSFGHFRYHLTNQFRSHMAHPYGDIAAALITGDRSGIDPTVRQHFTDAGIAHVLAISGLHMGLLAGLIFFFLRRVVCVLHLSRSISETTPIRSIAAVLTLGAMWLYLMISGYGYPAIRSFIMTALVMMGMIIARDPVSMRSLALAAITLLILFPESLLSISFELSFAAVAALVAAYELKGHQWIASWREHFAYHFLAKVGLYFLTIMLTTIIATLATTPLSMAIFNKLTLQAIIGNCLTLPLIAFWIMPMAILSVIVSMMPMDFLMQGTFWLFERGIALLVFCATWVSSLPGASILVPSPAPWFFPIFALGGCILCIGPYSKLRWAGGGMVLISFTAFFIKTVPVGYISGNRMVMAFYDPPYFRVSNRHQGQFYIDQWRQHLGVSPDHVVAIHHPIFLWNGFGVLCDPFRMEKSDGTFVKKSHPSASIRSWQRYVMHTTADHFLITNTFVNKGYLKKAKDRFVIHGQLLFHKGNSYIYSDGTIQFDGDQRSKRPWE